jgi:hypothetical protein
VNQALVFAGPVRGRKDRGASISYR